MANYRTYVGIKHDLTREIFSADFKPTGKEFGHIYIYAIGPFETKRGAAYMRDFGQGNPLCVTVAQAERLAKTRA